MSDHVGRAPWVIDAASIVKLAESATRLQQLDLEKLIRQSPFAQTRPRAQTKAQHASGEPGVFERNWRRLLDPGADWPPPQADAPGCQRAYPTKEQTLEFLWRRSKGIKVDHATLYATRKVAKATAITEYMGRWIIRNFTK
jgi:hypothetical protein